MNSNAEKEIFYETSAFIFVGGNTDLTLEDINRSLEIQPTKTSNDPLKGNAKRPGGRRAWFFWTKSTHEPKERSVEGIIEEITSGIEEKKEKFSSLPDDCDREIVVTIYSDYSNITIDISGNALKKLSEFTFSLRVSTYAGSN